MINLVRVGVFEEMTGVEKEFGWHSLAAMSAGFYSIKRILYCRPINAQRNRWSSALSERLFKKQNS